MPYICTKQVVSTPSFGPFFSQILDQIPIENDPKKKDTDDLYSRASKETPIDISPRMLISILKVRTYVFTGGWFGIPQGIVGAL